MKQFPIHYKRIHSKPTYFKLLRTTVTCPCLADCWAENSPLPAAPTSITSCFSSAAKMLGTSPVLSTLSISSRKASSLIWVSVIRKTVFWPFTPTLFSRPFGQKTKQTTWAERSSYLGVVLSLPSLSLSLSNKNTLALGQYFFPLLVEITLHFLHVLGEWPTWVSMFTVAYTSLWIQGKGWDWSRAQSLLTWGTEIETQTISVLLRHKV